MKMIDILIYVFGIFTSFGNQNLFWKVIIELPVAVSQDMILLLLLQGMKMGNNIYWSLVLKIIIFTCTHLKYLSEALKKTIYGYSSICVWYLRENFIYSEKISVNNTDISIRYPSFNTGMYESYYIKIVIITLIL